MIYRQIYRRAALTSFDVDPKVHRSLSLCLPRIRQERCPHRAQKGPSGGTQLFKFYRQTDDSAEPHTCKVLRRSYHTITPYIPIAEVGGFTALFR